MANRIPVYVYGSEERCASCVNLPSSRETADWLQAALNRRYGASQVTVSFVDIYKAEEEEMKRLSRRILEEDRWYPVVVIEGEIVAEGNPRLKDIMMKLDQMGALLVQSS